MSLSKLRQEKGFAIVSVSLVAFLILTLSGTTYARAFMETGQVNREVSHFQSYAAAEAGLQRALVQLGTTNAFSGQGAYSGFLNLARGNSTLSTSTSYSYQFPNQNQDDWVVVQSTGTAPDGTPTTLEGRIFMDSNFSKYMMYANASVGLGTNLRLGFSDGVNPEGVPANGDARNLLYYTGNLSFSGSNVQVYGDILTERAITGSGGGNSQIHGDTYSWNFNQNSFGQVSSSGVNPNIRVGDGFADDYDRDGDGMITTRDYPDYHQLTQNGGGDSKAKETVDPIDVDWYKNTVQSTTGTEVIKIPGNSTQNRYLKLEVDPSNQNTTRVVEYSSATYQEPVATYSLGSKTNGVIYTDSNVFVKGEVQGRITLVSNQNVYFAGDVTYAGGRHTIDATNPSAVSFFAKNKLYFVPQRVEVSGILYADREGGSGNSLAIDAGKTFDPYFNLVDTIQCGSGSGCVNTKENGHFRHYGSIVMDGGSNTSLYLNDRAYLYDPEVKNYRPPGIPVRPSLRVTREI